MKKNLMTLCSILLTVILLIHFVGCNQGASTGERSTQKPGQTNTPVSTQIATPTPTQTPTVTPTETPTRTPGCVTSPPTTDVPVDESVTSRAQDLMKGISSTSEGVLIVPTIGDFVGSTTDFSIKLFQKTYSRENNTLISPISVLTALAMTANGADGNTLAQMEAVLGGDVPLEALNSHLHNYLYGWERNDTVKMSYANSIWFRDTTLFTPNQAFLQKNADYYGAAIYKASFDKQTLNDINRWVTENTDGMIETILDKIPPDAMMYLINTLVFDGEWETVYSKNSIRTGSFTNISGTTQNAEMMYSDESRYLDDGKATGFIKNYKGGQYSFVALLPNEGVSLEDYVATLSGESFRRTLQNAKNTMVYATIPKFSYESNLTLNDALVAMGMEDAFSADKANFSKMGESAVGNLYIDRVIHKTFISVDELGTKAGAATIVELPGKAMPQETYTVTLDRPFVYAIVDNATGLPIFMGAVVSLG